MASGRHVADQLPQHNFADMRDCFLVLPCSFFAPKVLGSFHAQTLFIVTCLQVYFFGNEGPKLNLPPPNFGEAVQRASTFPLRELTKVDCS